MIKFFRILGIALTPFILIFIYVYISSSGLVGNLPEDGDIISKPRPIEKKDLSQKQILFGDLHVHTTFSQDAFLFSLPMLQGEGVHPPADACTFARFCSSLDFFPSLIMLRNDEANVGRFDKIYKKLRFCFVWRE